ncbi:MAG: hypothetical protein EOM59_10805 [Clostridia bacterium]|nr:hypothetical protein [Clostridia bacterium]
MSVKIDICNLALGHLGMRAITTTMLTANTDPSAIACNNFYDPARDDTLSEISWSFATVREALTVTTDTVLGWDYIYTYPKNAMTVWCVFDESTVDEKYKQNFEVIYLPSSEKKVVCSDLSDAYSDYTYKVTDTTIYSPKFIMAMSYRLAAAMAHTLTGSVDVGLKLVELHNSVISEAKRIGNVEKIRIPKQTSSYQSSRG